MARGGKAFICLHATREGKDGKPVSNIVPTLELGDMVTVPASDVSYIVTEYGMVNLKGKSVWQRAKALISIAHPIFREKLTEAAITRQVSLPGGRWGRGGSNLPQLLITACATAYSSSGRSEPIRYFLPLVVVNLTPRVPRI